MPEEFATWKALIDAMRACQDATDEASKKRALDQFNAAGSTAARSVAEFLASLDADQLEWLVGLMQRYLGVDEKSLEARMVEWLGDQLN